MWLIDVASKKVQTEYFKVVFMTLFKFDTLKTLENDAHFLIRYDLFFIVYISMSIPLFNKSKVCFVN